MCIVLYNECKEKKVKPSMMPTSEEGGDGVAARWTFRHPAPGSSRPSSPSQPSCYWPRLGLDKFTLINNQMAELGLIIE